MTLVIVTPSFAPDFKAFLRLHESVERLCDPKIQHIAIVPDKDIKLFRSVSSPRLSILPESDALPTNFVFTPSIARLPIFPRGYRVSALNRRRIWPPIRSWIFQQVLKLSVISQLDADVAMHVDSDVMLVRPLTESTFKRLDAIRLYRQPYGIHAAMKRHIKWQRTAAKLLGRTKLEEDSPDYISSFGSWSPGLVSNCLKHVEHIAGREWHDVIASRLQFSEFILYGTYATAVANPQATFASDRSLCHSYWTPEPMDRAHAEVFLDSMRPDDIAILIQSNSGTSEDILQFVSESVMHLD